MLCLDELQMKLPTIGNLILLLGYVPSKLRAQKASNPRAVLQFCRALHKC